MKKIDLILIAIALIAGSLYIWGCGNNNGNPVQAASGVPQILKIVPADGATNVAGNSDLAITFNMPMDTASVRGAFFLSGGDSMTTWMDSLGHHMMMGNMTDMSHMMDWMDSIMDTSRFEWNQSHDSCLVHPYAPLSPNTDYMILMYGSIKGGNGMMMDMETGGEKSNYEMFHFRTGP
ncbi:conserved hypothetical protein [Candidatus Zixiibacteriota bacterium]|nr:conserved hypothetical protein [candidate division Zixibacteria bacterium]